MDKIKINLKVLIVSLGFSFILMFICFIGINYAFIKSGWGFQYWSILILVCSGYISFKIYDEIKG